MKGRRRTVAAVVVALGACCALAGCAKDKQQKLRELRDEACACKSQSCAAEVGKRLASLATESELDEAGGRLALEAGTCLATFGE